MTGIPACRRTISATAIAFALAGCNRDSALLDPGERGAVADSIRALVIRTYDLGKPGAVERLMTLYPPAGPVISTSSGHVSTTRQELRGQIQTFWQYVGSNMREPRWEWTAMHVDVLSADAAVLTASYRVPHLTPANRPHVIAGAWTAVFARRGGRWVVIQEHLSDVPAARASAGEQDHSGH